MSEGKKRSNEAAGGQPQKKPKQTKSGWHARKHTSDKAIPVGAIGIFATCDAGKERRAADELTHLLDEAFTRLGKDHMGHSQQQQQHVAGDGAAGKKSVDALLAAEVAVLRDKRKDRFKRHDPNVRGTFFLEFPKEDDCPSPEEVAVNIAQHVRETQALPARHLMRMLPVSQTCFVAAEDVQAMAAKLAEQHFPSGEAAEQVHFAVDFEHRACDKLKRNDVINIFAKAVPQPPHKVNLKFPQKTIVVQLVRNICTASVVSGYRDLLRLNLRKLIEEQEDAEREQQQPAASKQDAEAAVTQESAEKQPAVEP